MDTLKNKIKKVGGVGKGWGGEGWKGGANLGDVFFFLGRRACRSTCVYTYHHTTALTQRPLTVKRHAKILERAVCRAYGRAATKDTVQTCGGPHCRREQKLRDEASVVCSGWRMILHPVRSVQRGIHLTSAEGAAHYEGAGGRQYGARPHRQRRPRSSGGGDIVKWRFVRHHGVAGKGSHQPACALVEGAHRASWDGV